MRRGTAPRREGPRAWGEAAELKTQATDSKCILLIGVWLDVARRPGAPAPGPRAQGPAGRMGLDMRRQKRRRVVQ
jgi:hypothetical protein